MKLSYHSDSNETDKQWIAFNPTKRYTKTYEEAEYHYGKDIYDMLRRAHEDTENEEKYTRRMKYRDNPAIDNVNRWVDTKYAKPDEDEAIVSDKKRLTEWDEAFKGVK